MTSLLYFQSTLLASGCNLTEIPLRERWRVEQSWRETYARATHVRTGKWRIPDFEWHVFSYGDSPAKSGGAALELYSAEPPTEFYAWPEVPSLPMFHCTPGSFPLFTAEYLNIHVFPCSLEWTMAFTHELSMDLGPYFSRREWQSSSAP